MAYLGNAPARSFISFERQVFTIVNSQTAYTLSHSVTNENDIRLVINNIVQEPGSGKAYTASGTTLTLSAALVNGTDEMYCVFLGRAVGTVVPPNNSVTSAKLASQDITFSEDIILGDSKKAIFGAGSDLQIYHDGSNSYVDDTGTGRLYLRGDNRVQIQKYTGEDMVTAIADGAVNLYYDNSKKLETTSSGINITGGVRLGGNNAANELDDYEEGTFTPKLEGSSTSGSSPTGAGRYTKIGNLVHIDFSFVNKTISGAVGDLRIKELPFTISGADSVRGSFGGNVRFYNYDLDGNTYYQLTLVADQNTTYLVVTQTRDHGTWDTLGVDNDSGLYVEGGITYTTTA